MGVNMARRALRGADDTTAEPTVTGYLDVDGRITGTWYL